MKIGLREATIETGNYVATSEAYWAAVKRKQSNDQENLLYLPIRRIDVRCKRSGANFRFPLTVRKGVQSFGDTRETSLTHLRYSTTEMKAELARMVGLGNAEDLLDVFVAFQSAHEKCVQERKAKELRKQHRRGVAAMEENEKEKSK